MAEKNLFKVPAKRNFNESLNYEDRIIANVVRKKIAALVDEAVKNDVKITSNYFDDREKALFGEILRLNNLNELTINAWADPDGNAVNIPITPTLLNLAATAEELAHLRAYSKEVLDAHNIGDYEGVQRNYRDILIEQELIFAEEMRAKNIADKTVGGYLPESARYTSAFKNDYAYSFLDALREFAPQKIPEMMEKYPDLKNAKDLYDPEAIEYEKEKKEKVEAYERWVNKAMPDFYEGGFQAAEFMKGKNSDMAISDEVLNTALDHIHAYESQRGTLKKTDDSGGTRSEYHMRVEVAAEYDDRFNGMTQDQYNAVITPPEEKALVSKHLEVLRQEATDAGVNFDSLNAGEQVSLLSTLFNRRKQPNTLQSFSQLTFARDNNRPDQEDFRIAARNSLDVTKDAGERNLGVMHRTVSHRQTFDGNVNVDETYNAKPAEQFPDGYMGDLYADIHSTSKASESFREKAIRVRERSAYFMQPLQDKKPDVQIIPGRQGEPFMGVPVPPPRPDRSPEEISGFPAEATFP